MNERKIIIKGGYLVEVDGHDRNKVIWEVLDDNVLEEATYHDEIVLWGFDFDLFNKYKKGIGREGYSEFPYLIILTNI